MENNNCVETEETKKNRKKPRVKLYICICVLLAAAILSYTLYWRNEEKKTFHRTKNAAYARIETPYYALEVPAKWLDYVSVQIEPVNEVYGGWEENGQSLIWEKNYQVELAFETDSGTYPAANIAMYKYPNDCLEQLDDWEEWGKLDVGILRKGDPYGRGEWNFCQIVVDYAAEPEGLSTEELAVWNSIKSSLSADMLQPREYTDDLCTKFTKRKTDDPHGGARTWAESRKKSEELAKRLAEVEKQREEREQQEEEKSANKSGSASASAGSTSSSSSGKTTSSSAKKCKYSGCKNYGVSYKRGYCNKHYEQLYGKRDDYYDEDPESYYQDNKSSYSSRSEAYDDWEDEYEED